MFDFALQLSCLVGLFYHLPAPGYSRPASSSAPLVSHVQCNPADTMIASLKGVDIHFYFQTDLMTASIGCRRIQVVEIKKAVFASMKPLLCCTGLSLELNSRMLQYSLV